MIMIVVTMTMFGPALGHTTSCPLRTGAVFLGVRRPRGEDDNHFVQ
jgi:hypothetical protein